jgi:hypothetical protein
MSTTPTITDNRAYPVDAGWRRLSLAGFAAGLAATAVIEIYGAIGRATGVPMVAGSPGAHAAGRITVATFFMAVFVCTFWGTVLAVLFARLARRPVRTFVRTTLVLTAISLASPLDGAHTTTATKLFLACGHLIAAAIILPILARQLQGRAGRALVEGASMDQRRPVR